jgi:predicted NUDIX family phosphoesterase
VSELQAKAVSDDSALLSVRIRRHSRSHTTGEITVSDHETEQVLCVPTMLFHEIGWFQGFQPNTGPYLRTLLDPAHSRYLPRSEVETDPSWKQLIPYCIFIHAGQILHYTRGKAGGEARLRSLRSVGIGGHISIEDRQNVPDAVYATGMRREIEEEIEIGTAWTESLVGLINDDETDVGRVHLGVVHLFRLDQPKVRPREASIKDTGFAPPADLIARLEEFETWSQICLENLFRDGRMPAEAASGGAEPEDSPPGK